MLDRLECVLTIAHWLVVVQQLIQLLAFVVLYFSLFVKIWTHLCLLAVNYSDVYLLAERFLFWRADCRQLCVQADLLIHLTNLCYQNFFHH